MQQAYEITANHMEWPIISSPGIRLTLPLPVWLGSLSECISQATLTYKGFQPAFSPWVKARFPCWMNRLLKSMEFLWKDAVCLCVRVCVLCI